jgi:acetyl esterase/lipase
MRILVLLTMAIMAGFAQTEIIRLYDGPPPGTETWNWTETELRSDDGIRRVANVTQPSLTIFRPPADRNTGTGIVVAPGGGFRILAINHEGEDVAAWLAERGVTVFLLKYRVMRSGDDESKDPEVMARRRTQAIPLAVADGMRAMQVARQHAGRLAVDPARIGILGFSAGGWVTTAVATEGEGDSRPAFAAPIYAAMPETLRTPARPMPLFLVHAHDDKTVIAARTSVRLYQLWHEAGAPAELHIFSKGGHGFGMRKKDLPSDHWIEKLWAWMQAESLVRPALTIPR